MQRVLSANNLRAAKMAPVIGAAFKMAVPLIVIVPGLIALGLHNADGTPLYHLVADRRRQARPAARATTRSSRSCSSATADPGLLGLGITALVAGFMSGMAGNVSAFSTVWTYDLYGAFMNKKASATATTSPWAAGPPSSACWSRSSPPTCSSNATGIMDYVQALFSFFIAPLFGTVILGMLWKGATKAGGFWGLVAGTAASITMFVWVHNAPSALCVTLP